MSALMSHISMKWIRQSFQEHLKSSAIPKRRHFLRYETVGVAAQDLVAAKVIYDKALEAGKGMNWG